MTMQEETVTKNTHNKMISKNVAVVYLIHLLLALNLPRQVYTAGGLGDNVLDHSGPVMGTLCGRFVQRRCHPIYEYCDVETNRCTHCIERCAFRYPDATCTGSCPYYLQSLAQAPPEVKDVLNTTTSTPPLNITQGDPKEDSVEQSGSSKMKTVCIVLGVVICICLCALIAIVCYCRCSQKTKSTATEAVTENGENIPMINIEQPRTQGDNQTDNQSPIEIIVHGDADAGDVADDDARVVTGDGAGDDVGADAGSDARSDVVADAGAVVGNNAGADPQDTRATTQDGEVDPLVSAQPEGAAVQGEYTTTQDDELLRAQAHADAHSRQQQTRPKAEAGLERNAEEEPPQQLAASAGQRDQPASASYQSSVSSPSVVASSTDQDVRPKQLTTRTTRPTNSSNSTSRANTRTSVGDEPGHRHTDASFNLSPTHHSSTARVSSSTQDPPSLTTIQLQAVEPSRGRDQAPEVVRQHASSPRQSAPEPPGLPTQRAHEQRLATERDAGIRPLRSPSTQRPQRVLSSRGPSGRSPPPQGSTQERPNTLPISQLVPVATTSQYIHTVANPPPTTDPRYPSSNTAAGTADTSGYRSADASLVTIDATQQDAEAYGSMSPEHERKNIINKCLRSNIRV